MTDRKHIIVPLDDDQLSKFPRTLKYDNPEAGCDLWVVSWVSLPSGRVDLMAAGPFTREDAEQLSDSGEMGRLSPDSPMSHAEATSEECYRKVCKLIGMARGEHSEDFEGVWDDRSGGRSEAFAETETETEPEAPEQAKLFKHESSSWRRQQIGQWFGPLPVGPRPIGWSLEAHTVQKPFIVLDVEASLLEALLNELDQNHAQSLSFSHSIALPADASKPFGSEPRVLVVCYCSLYHQRKLVHRIARDDSGPGPGSDPGPEAA